MTWVITRLCSDCVDMSCVDVCPVDCIVSPASEETKVTMGNDQLFIDPEQCIDCGVCEAECPWEAIFADDDVPEIFHDDIALNASILEIRDQFEVPERPDDMPIPSPDEVTSNKEKWNYHT